MRFQQDRCLKQAIAPPMVSSGPHYGTSVRANMRARIPIQAATKQRSDCNLQFLGESVGAESVGAPFTAASAALGQTQFTIVFFFAHPRCQFHCNPRSFFGMLSVLSTRNSQRTWLQVGMLQIAPWGAQVALQPAPWGVAGCNATCALRGCRLQCNLRPRRLQVAMQPAPVFCLSGPLQIENSDVGGCRLQCNLRPRGLQVAMQPALSGVAGCNANCALGGCRLQCSLRPGGRRLHCNLRLCLGLFGPVKLENPSARGCWLQCHWRIFCAARCGTLHSSVHSLFNLSGTSQINGTQTDSPTNHRRRLQQPATWSVLQQICFGHRKVAFHEK